MGFKSCPRVGGIPKPAGGRILIARFQVVPPCGGHPHNFAIFRHIILVSSRAPVWGASTEDTNHALRQSRFKSCPRVGGIYGGEKGPGFGYCFKSCPRVGGILPLSQLPQAPKEFQVVPPCGGHLKTPLSLAEVQIVSSRAPVWGAS